MHKLYIVGTPIGNIKDITYRAVDVLKSVDVIACEDKRVSQKLLNHYGIKQARIISHHEHNESKSAKGVIDMILDEKSVALISDAGMPVINDPGFVLIREAIKRGVKVEIIPGPSATLTALALSNFDTHFTFHGFLKHKQQQRINQLLKLKKGTHIFFASPHRIIQELEDIKATLQSNFKIFVGRELTKKHELQYRGDIDVMIQDLSKNKKGEFTIVIEILKNKKDLKW